MNIIGQDKLISKIDSYNNITDFPRCKNVYNLTPTNTLCPKCGSIMFKDGDKLICSNEECK